MNMLRLQINDYYKFYFLFDLCFQNVKKNIQCHDKAQMLGCHLKILLLFLALSSCFGPTTSSVRFGSENPYLHSEIVESPFYSAVVASWPDEQKLIFELLNNYDSAVRPVFNASKPVGISFSLSLIQISDMVTFILNLNKSNHALQVFFVYLQDEKNQILTANVWIEQVRINQLVRSVNFVLQMV